MTDLTNIVKPLVWSWNERAGLFEAENPVTFITMCAATEEDCEDSNARYTARILAALDLTPAPDLSDPVAVHLNMLRGTIAKPSVEQIIHLYGAEVLRAALALDPAVLAALPEVLALIDAEREWCAKVADKFHNEAIRWAKSQPWLVGHGEETDSSRIAAAIRKGADQ